MELLDDYDIVEQDISSMVSIDIQSQLDALKLENESLKKQIQAKDSIIESFESQISNKQIDKVILQEINKLLDTYDFDEGATKRITEIIKNEDLSNKLQSLFNFIRSLLKRNEKIISRLCGIIKDNANFLVSMIQEQTQNKYKDMIIERAEKTVSSIKGLRASPNKFDSMKSILTLNVDYEQRKKSIESVISNQKLPYEELQSYFIREVSISSKLAQMLIEERSQPPVVQEVNPISEDTIFRLSAVFGQKLSSASMSLDNTLDIICAACEKYQETYGADIFSIINDMQAKIDSLQALDTRNRAILAMQAAELAKYVG